MISVDTNILVRAVLDDHVHDSALARRILRETANDGNLFISSYAIVEMIWVLKVKKISRSYICEALLDLLDSPGIVIGQREIVVSALEMYKKGRADFADYLILAEGKAHGAPKLLSFDKKLCMGQKQVSFPSEYLEATST